MNPTRRFPAGRALLSALALGAVLLVATPDARAISQEEVITLTKLGIAPEEIIQAIEKDRSVFDLSVQDILSLKKADVDEKVIQFMLATPKKYGEAEAGDDEEAAPAEAGEAPAEEAAPAEPEETEEERRAREERMRQEALRMMEEKKAAEEAQRKAYAKGVLAKGRRLAEEGKFVASIQAFQRFLAQGDYPPDSEEAYFAKFGIADALVKAGLHQAAARQLVEVLLAGPDKPFFKTAFEQLRELRSKVNYSPPDLEQLTRFFVGEYSQSFQDQYNYVLGEFYYDYNNWSKALNYLQQVSPGADDYARAQYLKGLVEVRNQLFKSAVSSFQNAILATEDNESDPEVADLSYLALARIAYENYDHDAAIYYYRKVPSGSYKRAQALYESAWVYFVKGDASRALGTFHTLHSPFFEHRLYPELWILEATTYMNICRYDYAEEALGMFDERIAPLAVPLKEYLNKVLRPEDHYKALVETLNGKTVWGLPEELTRPVLADIEFYNLYRTIQQIEEEIDTLAPHAGELGTFGQDMLARLKQLRADRVREIGIKIQRVLRDVAATLDEYQTKAREIRVDLRMQRLEKKQQELRELEAGAEEEAKQKAEAGGAVAIVGSDSWQWPFEGEYWKDEIGSYRAFVSDQCPREGQ
ncbi:MAG: tetratricopeptide repeat protein [Myxococcota bacterium]